MRGHRRLPRMGGAGVRRSGAWRGFRTRARRAHPGRAPGRQDVDRGAPRRMRVTVGVHVHAEPQRLARTLTALTAGDRRPLDVLLLGDGPDAPTARALDGIALPQCTTSRPRGAPACFNRLATTEADVVVLLESGAIPAPGALDRLVNALTGGVGIAGPSTTSAWNEQGMWPSVPGTPDGVARAGRLAERRFGAATRSLAPLHGLADFCFAVRRDVVEAIGGADEGYGLGPCW